MAFQLLAIVVALLVGWVRGGRLGNLARVRLRHVWVLPVAYLLQYLSIYHLRGLAYEVLVVLSYACLIAFCVRNLDSKGIIWALLGISANFIVMMANHLRMPAYVPAVEAYAPGLVPELQDGAIGKSVAMSTNTHLNFLGDIFTVQLGVPTLVSIGDLMFSVGLFLFIVAAMRGHSSAKSDPRD